MWYIRAVVIFPEEAPLALRDAAFDRRDAPPAAIVWYVEADADGESVKRSRVPQPHIDIIPSPIADWPSMSDTIIAGEAGRTKAGADI